MAWQKEKERNIWWKAKGFFERIPPRTHTVEPFRKLPVLDWPTHAESLFGLQKAHSLHTAHNTAPWVALKYIQEKSHITCTCYDVIVIHAVLNQTYFGKKDPKRLDAASIILLFRGHFKHESLFVTHFAFVIWTFQGKREFFLDIVTVFIDCFMKSQEPEWKFAKNKSYIAMAIYGYDQPIITLSKIETEDSVTL